jgi:hypothetical protein
VAFTIVNALGEEMVRGFGSADQGAMDLQVQNLPNGTYQVVITAIQDGELWRTEPTPLATASIVVVH